MLRNLWLAAAGKAYMLYLSRYPGTVIEASRSRSLRIQKLKAFLLKLYRFDRLHSFGNCFGAKTITAIGIDIDVNFQ
jgi:hypothetical protein